MTVAPKKQILAFEDDSLFQAQLELLFDDDKFELTLSPNGEKGIKLLQLNPQKYDVVICDFDLPDMKGDDIAKRVHFINPDLPIVFSTAHKEQMVLMSLLKAGVARGFFLKGQNLDELRQVVEPLADQYHSKYRIVEMSSSPEPLQYNMVAHAPVMRSLIKKIERYREFDMSVLLLGESGTGKELVARALHKEGAPFVAINCAKYSSDVQLLESELFGYVKGAFTGAHSSQSGLLVAAHGGTLFLDEVHTLSLPAQQKLLRVLQEKKFRRVGENSSKETEIVFRLVAAAKPDLQQRIAEGSFLIDFYYRINMLSLSIPTLEQRPEDLTLLITHFAQNVNQRLNINVKFRTQTIEYMKEFSWPGQVRELRNAVERMMVDAEAGIVEPIHFDEYIRSQMTSNKSIAPTDARTYKEHSAVSDYLYFKNLMTSDSDRNKWAEISGLSRATLYRKLSELELISTQT